MARQTDTDLEIQVLTLLARGDTHEEVQRATGLSHTTIIAIKKRNPAALAVIQEKLMDHQITTSRKILSKAHGLIEKKLDQATKATDTKQTALASLHNDEISFEEYQKMTYGLTDVTLNELNSVAKEAFNQSQIEQGKPTSISSSPNEAKEDLMRLVTALNNDDHEALVKELFDRDVVEAELVEEKPDETDEPQPVQDPAL